MNIFLTGGTGFVGSHFLKMALEEGHKVFSLRRPASKPKIIFENNPIWCNGSLDDDWSNQLKECDVVVHLAAAGVIEDKRNWQKCFQINLTDTLSLLRLAINCGIRKFLICGSCFEYGKASNDFTYIPENSHLIPIDAYSSSKAAATMACIGLANEFKLHLLVARLFQVYGEGENEKRFWPSLVKAANENKDFHMTEGKQLRDFIYVKDAVKILLDYATQLDSITIGGTIKNVGSGKPISLIEFAEGEWARLHAKGKLKAGKIPYRKNEIMSYLPLIN